MPRLEKVIAHALVAIAIGLSIPSSAVGQKRTEEAAFGRARSVMPQAPATASCAPSWRPTFGPSPGPDGMVDCLAVFDDGSGPALYAGGVFQNAGAATASYVAKWNGASWASLGNEFDGEVLDLAVFDDGSGPTLYAGGRFRLGVGFENNLAKWNGSTWLPLGSKFDDAVLALTVFDDGEGAALYAGGQFSLVGLVAAGSIAKWNGASWAPLGHGMDNTVESLAVFDDGSGPALFAGGDFTRAGTVMAEHIAKWDGSSWASLGTGMNEPVRALTVFDDGSGPVLCAGGGFTTAGGVAANRVAKWNGSSWAPLGSGFTAGQPPFAPSVFALTVCDDGSALFAGGRFTAAGQVAANNVAKWNGSVWAPLGSGLNGVPLLTPPPVAALAVFDDGSGAALFAGGGFSSNSAGDGYLAKWGCSLPAGARTYGASSPGCAGALAMGVTSSPKVGNAGFAMTCSNTPPGAPGAFFAGTAFMAPMPILGIQIWVSPIVSLGIASSASGSTAIPLPLPPDPTLVGGQFDVQTIWLGPTAPPPCPTNGLSASNALELTVQP